MIVEKFVAKVSQWRSHDQLSHDTQSGPPYKLPALYVIDSIIRQSRHQFQGQKEVYGPRFGSKLDKLFPHILECLEIDRVSTFTDTTQSMSWLLFCCTNNYFVSMCIIMFYFARSFEMISFSLLTEVCVLIIA